MRLVLLSGGIAMLLAGASSANAQLPGHGSGTECPAGMMPAPQSPEAASMPSLNPTSVIASAAKKKILGSKPKADSAVAAKPKCLTPEQFAAEAKAQQTAAIKGAATAALAATPIGMAVVAGKAAAPVAGKVAGALSNRFRRGGQSKESMLKELVAGKLEVDNLGFDAGADSPNASSVKALLLLSEVLKGTEGRYVIRVTPESDGTKAADPRLAYLRGQLLMASLVVAGVPADRITVAPPTAVTSWDKGAPKKTEARLEIVPLAAAPPSSAAKK